MRFLLAALLTALAAYFALMVMPWWIPMPAAFVIALLLPMKKGTAFMATGLGAAACYTLICLLTDNANQHILSTRMATLFHLPASWLMIPVTALAGFVTAGLGGWTGAAFKLLFRRREALNTATPQT